MKEYGNTKLFMLKKHFNKFVRSDEENLFVKYSPRGKKMSLSNKNTTYEYDAKIGMINMKKNFLLYLCLLFCISCLFSSEYIPIEINPSTGIQEKNITQKTFFDTKYMCLINSGYYASAEKIIDNSIEYIVVYNDDKEIYRKTEDINFFTKEQLSISDSILTFFATYGTNIKVEPGVCFFLELNDGWNACLSTDGIIDLYKPILFFYKVDKSYSRAESLTDWYNYYYN